jgi:hypothetical protein
MILLPLALALTLMVAFVVDPLRVVGGVIIGSDDRTTPDTIFRALIWSMIVGLIYAVVFWLGAYPRFASFWAWAGWTLIVAPLLTVYAALAVNWMRQVPRIIAGREGR